jgi:hypothetical protein
MTLVEQLTKGEVYVKNDCTPEEMNRILVKGFPEDLIILQKIGILRWACYGMHPSIKGDWLFFNKDEPEYKKAISAKEFLKELNTKHEH